MNSTELNNATAVFVYSEAAANAARCVEMLRLYAAPALTVACLVGSCLILFSALKRRRTLQPKHYVLVTLTLADLVTILSSVFFNQFLYYGLGVPMPHAVSDVACKLWSLVWILGNGMSANLLCFLAIDRLYAVSRPLQHRACTSCGRYCLLLAAFCVPFLVVGAFGAATFRVYEYLGQRHCYIDVSLPTGLGVAYQAYATLIANGTLGSCFLLVANAVLACRLCAIARSRRQRWRQQQEMAAGGQQPTESFSDLSGSSSWVSRPQRKQNQPQQLDIEPSTAEAEASDRRQQRHQQRPRQMPPNASTAAVRTGVTLMAASAAHLAGSLPRAVTYLIAGVIQYGGLANSESEAVRLRLVFELGGCFDYLFYANCSLNWLIYCAKVPELRPW